MTSCWLRCSSGLVRGRGRRWMVDGVVTRPSPVCRGWCGLSWPAERRTVITMVPAQTQEHYPAPPPSTQHNTGWVDSQSWRILRYPHDFHLIHHFPRYNSELREVLEPLFRETSIIQPDSRLQPSLMLYWRLVGGRASLCPQICPFTRQRRVQQTNNLHRVGHRAD